ncbi:ThiF family adenylyltransferase [Roseofilum sp. Guam]|uniref:HesA/MoeB/ThiF family protein n=1 Tax=Roseofilum sp. Guam TaxID=2821502 RepID=UPI001AFE31AF|nr:ThiF family adenylyltransferase [Roseofilum sp. Guam]MBP0031008.1 ThiF family adenylyltransferase [Roseofilum sp. Guam]
MEWELPQIKRSHHVVVNEQGDVCIGQIPGLSKIVRNPPSWFIPLLERLDGSKRVDDIIQELRNLEYQVTRDEIFHIIQSLGQFNLLEDAQRQSQLLSTEELERYDRQILQFSLCDRQGLPGFVYQEQLKNSTVLILGVGGWGSWIALQLALLGIGTLRLVDGDEVELSNLNRQVLYDRNSIGKPKVLAAQEKIKEINPHVNCEVYEYFVGADRQQIDKLVEGIDLILLAWTNLGIYCSEPITETLHQVALNKKIPLMEFGADPLEVIVGPIYLQDGSCPSYSELQGTLKQAFYSVDENIQSFQKAEIMRNYRDGNRIVKNWHSCPALSIASGMVADQAIKVLTNYDEPILVGKRFKISLRTFESKIEFLHFDF